MELIFEGGEVMTEREKNSIVDEIIKILRRHNLSIATAKIILQEVSSSMEKRKV